MTNLLLEDLRHNGDFSSNNTGDISEVTGLDNVRQAILNRILTIKGSLAHRPDYGLGIKRFKGMLTTITNKRDMALEMRAQLEQDSRVISFDGLSITDQGSGKFNLMVKLTIIGYNTSSNFEFTEGELFND